MLHLTMARRVSDCPRCISIDLDFSSFATAISVELSTLISMAAVIWEDSTYLASGILYWEKMSFKNASGSVPLYAAHWLLRYAAECLPPSNALGDHLLCVLGCMIAR